MGDDGDDGDDDDDDDDDDGDDDDDDGDDDDDDDDTDTVEGSTDDGALCDVCNVRPASADAALRGLCVGCASAWIEQHRDD